MGPLRQIGSELVRAALVLAMVFLTFAHAPLSRGDDTRNAWEDGFKSVVAALHYCGGAPFGDPAEHAPCHACRIGAAADLPAPPQDGAPYRFAASVHYQPAYTAEKSYHFVVPFGARAPPALI